MRILHVITSLRVGGAEHLMVDLLPRLKDFNNDVDLLVFYGKRTKYFKELEESGIRVFSLSNNSFVYNPLNCIKLFFYIRKYDIVHTHLTSPQFFAAFCSIFSNVKMCTTEHNTTNRRREWKWFYFLDKWMYGRYDKIFCISDAAETNLRKYLKDEVSTKIVTIYNGIDISRYYNAIADKSLVELKGEHTAIVMVSTFRDQKDQDTLIKAMKLLTDNFVLWLVGDGERRKQLERLVDKLDLNNKVLFLGSCNNIPNILKASDIIVMSSHFEGLSLSNIEGMAAGRPFIASDVDGLKEVTQGAGLLFEHQNERQLADMIISLSNDSKEYNGVAEKCYNRSLRYDITETVIKYNHCYKEICAKRNE